jgi:hypothetical protein
LNQMLMISSSIQLSPKTPIDLLKIPIVSICMGKSKMATKTE